MYDAMRAEGHRASWTSVVHRLAYEWGLGDVWRQQKLPESAGNDDVGAWKARLRKLAKQRARVKLTGDLARRAPESRIASNYLDWLHFKDSAPQLEMAEYIRTARVEDEGAEIVFALRSGTSVLRADSDRLLVPRHLHRFETRICNKGKVEDAYHALAECPAHDAARHSLRSKLPEALRAVENRDTFDALMMKESLTRRCADAAAREAATEAVKCFWVRVLGHRHRAAKHKAAAHREKKNRGRTAPTKN